METCQHFVLHMNEVL